MKQLFTIVFICLSLHGFSQEYSNARPHSAINQHLKDHGKTRLSKNANVFDVDTIDIKIDESKFFNIYIKAKDPKTGDSTIACQGVVVLNDAGTYALTRNFSPTPYDPKGSLAGTSFKVEIVNNRVVVRVKGKASVNWTVSKELIQ
jgi:hypothetical protein